MNANFPSKEQTIAEIISVMESARDDGERNCQDLVRIHVGHICATIDVLKQLQSSPETSAPQGELMAGGELRCSVCGALWVLGHRCKSNPAVETSAPTETELLKAALLQCYCYYPDGPLHRGWIYRLIPDTEAECKRLGQIMRDNSPEDASALKASDSPFTACSVCKGDGCDACNRSGVKVRWQDTEKASADPGYDANGSPV